MAFALKLAYVGPSDAKRCLKTEAIDALAEVLPNKERGELTSVALEGDRLLFFERRPRSIEGLSIAELHVTAPGATHHEDTRRLPIRDVSAILFVPALRLPPSETLEAALELERHLREAGRDLAEVPLAFLYVHRSPEQLRRTDTTELPTATFETLFNPGRRPSFDVGLADGAKVRAAVDALVQLAVDDSPR